MRQFLLITLTLFLSACAEQASSPASAKKIILLMGQSNMSGRGAPVLPYISNGSKLFNFVNGNWVAATDPLDNEAEAGVGPGLKLASRLADHCNCDIGIVQAAQGGTNIDQWTSKHFTEAVFKLNQAEVSGGELIGVFWYQGESDAYSLSAAETWKAKFASLNDNWSVPVIYAQLGALGATSDPRFKYWNNVKQSQAQLALEVPKYKMVETDDLALMADGIHLSSDSAIEVGDRMADRFLE